MQDGSSNREKEALELAEHFLRHENLTTPFFSFSKNQLDYVLSLFSEHLPNIQLYYALKANSLPPIVKYLASKGLGIDAASAAEVKIAQDAGVAAKDIVLSNPIKDDASLHSIFRNRLGSYTFDSEGEVQKIALFRMRNGYANAPQSIVRIRVESKDVEIDLNEKFGCSLQEAVSLVKLANDHGLNPGGIQFHVGTQSYRSDNFLVGMDSAMLVARIAKQRFGVNLKTINIGGGFPDPVAAARHGISLEDLFKQIGESCQRAQDAGFTIIAEPGRVLVSSAATVVTKVIGLNERHGRRWLYLDDGVYGSYSGMFFDHKSFDFTPIRHDGSISGFSNTKHDYVVAGPTCDSIDVINSRALLPADLQVGDYLCTFNMGAYSASTASRFNGFGLYDCAIGHCAEANGDRRIETIAGVQPRLRVLAA